MKADPNRKVAVHIVWLSALGGGRSDLPYAVKSVSNAAAKHYWDTPNTLKKDYQQVLSTKTDAWDIFLVYGAGVRWSGKLPPKPTFWMHRGAFKEAPFLDGEVFAQKVAAMAAKVGH